MDTMYFVARDRDGKLYKYPYWNGMLETSKPYAHIRAYPFDGNFYAQGSDYRPKKGEEIDSALFPSVTYENSPVLVLERDASSRMVSSKEMRRLLYPLIGMRGTIQEVISKIEELTKKKISYDIVPVEQLDEIGANMDCELVFYTFQSDGDKTCYTVRYLQTLNPNIIYVTAII